MAFVKQQPRNIRLHLLVEKQTGTSCTNRRISIWKITGTSVVKEQFGTSSTIISKITSTGSVHVLLITEPRRYTSSPPDRKNSRSAAFQSFFQHREKKPGVFCKVHSQEAGVLLSNALIRWMGDPGHTLQIHVQDPMAQNLVSRFPLLGRFPQDTFSGH